MQKDYAFFRVFRQALAHAADLSQSWGDRWTVDAELRPRWPPPYNALQMYVPETSSRDSSRWVSAANAQSWRIARCFGCERCG